MKILGIVAVVLIVMMAGCGVEVETPKQLYSDEQYLDLLNKCNRDEMQLTALNEENARLGRLLHTTKVQLDNCKKDAYDFNRMNISLTSCNKERLELNLQKRDWISVENHCSDKLQRTRDRGSKDYKDQRDDYEQELDDIDDALADYDLCLTRGTDSCYYD